MLVDPFQRGTERIHNDYAGVGLGLAIVKSITRAHDGRLSLDPPADLNDGRGVRAAGLM
jgi:two-component system, OmpR family, sensor histidine kinase VanS